MAKRQNRILNQNYVQALYRTDGVNIVMGYFRRQRQHDYEFAIHTPADKSRPAFSFLNEFRTDKKVR